jgi:hypothetical protein
MGPANSCCGKNSAKRGLCFAEKLLQSQSLRTPIAGKDADNRGLVGLANVYHRYTTNRRLSRAEKRGECSAVLGLQQTPIVSKDAVDRGVGFAEKREESRTSYGS